MTYNFKTSILEQARREVIKQCRAQDAQKVLDAINYWKSVKRPSEEPNTQEGLSGDN